MMMNSDQLYMNRCLQLALLGKGKVAPNPLVGAVLVYHDRIIGEGWHKRYGEAHAEVNCINSVKEEDIPLIKKATLYVNLEPCSHFGKTPPCAQLIIQQAIPKVVIGIQDSFSEVSGRGIKMLEENGVEVIVNVLKKEAYELNRAFFIFHARHIPLVSLKWASSNNNMIAPKGIGKFKISNDLANVFTHQLRAYHDAILVGYQTYLLDQPGLTTRNWEGKNPLQLVIDLHATLDFKERNRDVPLLVYNYVKKGKNGLIEYIKVDAESVVNDILKDLYERQIQSVLIEGGSKTIQMFIDAHQWHQAYIITAENIKIENGVKAPNLIEYKPVYIQQLTDNTLRYFENREMDEFV